MMTLPKELAKEKIDHFIRRFSENYRLLAQYAALPLLLTPELLNYLRGQYLRGQVPWEAEADLLLSDLCSQVGYELYAMETSVRACLIEELEQQPNGKQRMAEVAHVLISYLHYLKKEKPHLTQKDLQAQQWSAMLYLESKRDIVIEEIKAAIQNSSSAELNSLKLLIEELAIQVKDYPELLSFAGLVTQELDSSKQPAVKERTILLIEDEPSNVERLTQILKQQGQFRVIHSEEIGEIISLVNNGEIDLILTNYRINHTFYQNKKITGVDLIVLLQAESRKNRVDPYIPIIGLSILTDKRQDFLTHADGFYDKRLVANDTEKFLNYINLVYNRVKQQEFLATRLDWSVNWSYSEYTTVTVDRKGEIIQQTLHQANYFVEDLSEEIALEMVYIPGGTFMMGSPKNEKNRYKSENPRHKVTVPSFFMSKYPITQEQWKAMAALDSIDQELELNPSHFKDDNRPVECVNWYAAREFCRRLSKLTEKEYRLPSEAEWEYACRAMRSPPTPLNKGGAEGGGIEGQGVRSYPFHFGATITTNLANYRGTDDDTYDWKGTYRDEPQGIYRGETNPVGQFPPNAFGLHNMHGNVWEWCLDDWHDNYEGAPTDGSAWLNKIENDNQKRRGVNADENTGISGDFKAGNDDDNDNQYSTKVLRGGSWFYNPRVCRSASRVRLNPADDFNTLGFRLVCDVG